MKLIIFGATGGTAIINHPELAILALGRMKDNIFPMSLTFDHRIIDGALGGAFLKRLGDIIESFDPQSGNFKIQY